MSDHRTGLPVCKFMEEASGGKGWVYKTMIASPHYSEASMHQLLKIATATFMASIWQAVYEMDTCAGQDTALVT